MNLNGAIGVKSSLEYFLDNQMDTVVLSLHEVNRKEELQAKSITFWQNTSEWISYKLRWLPQFIRNILFLPDKNMYDINRIITHINLWYMTEQTKENKRLINRVGQIFQNAILPEKEIAPLNPYAASIGIDNGGNRCYFNSALKALNSIPKFHEKLRSMLTDANPQQQQIIRSLLNFFDSIAGDADRAAMSHRGFDFQNNPSPIDLFAETLAQHLSVVQADQIHGFGQQDPHELLLFIFDLLQNMNFNFKSVEMPIIDEKSLDNPCTEHDTTSMLILRPGMSTSISDLFSGYHGERCLERIDLVGESGPDILPIQIARFQNLQKDTASVAIPLIIQPKLADTGHKDTYILRSVIIHDGATINRGHYYTYVPNTITKRNGLPYCDSWTVHNDSHVYTQKFYQIENDITKNGYMAFYEKR